MSTVTITTRAYNKDVERPQDFPKCKCGGEFSITDSFNKRGVHQLSAAICQSCNEYFCGYDVKDLYRAIPSGQAARDKDGSTYKANW